jgi:hypothetical protein
MVEGMKKPPDYWDVKASIRELEWVRERTTDASSKKFLLTAMQLLTLIARANLPPKEPSQWPK